MIEAQCETNLDGYDMDKYPKKFFAIPRIGDMVGSTITFQELEVCKITHKAYCSTGEPYIIIQLTKNIYIYNPKELK